MQYLIIGGGIAGTTSAQELRKLSSDAEITIIEQSPHRLYSKVILARYVTDELDRERLFLKPEKWYVDNRIELLTDTRVELIDLKNKFIVTSDKRELPYDKLLITTGQEPRLIDEDIKGIVYFRSLEDAENLKALIGEMKTRPIDEQRMIIVGGSFISMEFLHICQKLEISATVILRSDGFWSKVLSPESKNKILEKARELGIDVRLNTGFEIIQSDVFLGVKLDDGTEIKGSILAVGAGLLSDLSWLKESGLEVEQGLLCSSKLQTSDENVFAAGDIAQFDDAIAGRVRQVVNWTNAIGQGSLAANNMTGQDKEFKFVSSYATRIGDLELSFIGDIDQSKADNVRLLHQEDAILELFDRNNKTVGAIIIGSAKQRTEITNSISNSNNLYNL
ncbi:MAG: FAD-dependent pyridine nucleotide-disulfide oxidoreductase [uncultured bacterium]|uniref:FAD-dependent pyridine nucleotide-disulfide oxidoreductase n=1 Tax=Candidatus Uhrbacteria bacterium GW2011_GWC1_41_20 TaxID=1618983 RepID=A0A0G0VF94_9BACT|nr:MAG: FAD-dependent pyridine nucleotide-disulfide oxidoreductase [uncultured bacterium]KKR22790.1 MAG: FAD-dependent pyridine nucleotide-disulfide oxidoreductase [Candidatus Uhrbacteria bacterium GW2011_GWE1_39_46]KKR64146.1 MAG: FAD-dependent pyridine nucleotide-disulfide oxidoreductase [Candidatus Uhrbacteria bacterium GW2011_GWC2_40_450]KKR90281.1 MAG: FAD-dependent pyridine nucleotide-disulfide oxidoreductase [Candidatus Uhrbacteria bacterium GW2011_GWD2_41_121]KKR95208.1 MAG: FAD-depende